MAALGEIGYDGCVTIHQAYAELMGPHEAAVQTAEYLRSLNRAASRKQFLIRNVMCGYPETAGLL